MRINVNPAENLDHSMLFLVLEFLFFVGMLPILLFRVVMMSIHDWLCEFCEPRTFMTGVWTGLCGAYLMTVGEPDPSREYLTMTERLVAISIGSVTLPYLLIIAAVGIMVASIAIHFAASRQASARDPSQ
ncbi:MULTISPECIES: hypothetical protein [Xanthomonas]|uniref:hypothetical protein n=1 Tax=Xanthomonas TaxID=338 RepID=UPI001C47CABF|nr:MULTISPECIES: hypothetical protein [Xanthomonas]MBV6855902.1 hypothetical protein [Xanthomonas campestris pv. mirabilis]MEA9776928.1 hypothetical protein [Xanthomonas campestris pv. raphani]